MDLLSVAAGKMTEEHYSLVIVDSATALFRVDFSGRGSPLFSFVSFLAVNLLRWTTFLFSSFYRSTCRATTKARTISLSLDQDQWRYILPALCVLLSFRCFIFSLLHCYWTQSLMSPFWWPIKWSAILVPQPCSWPTPRSPLVAILWLMPPRLACSSAKGKENKEFAEFTILLRCPKASVYSR